ncbi:MAG: hypothetical protein L0Z62_09875 [Gemmataceae bacterium]|nr:hypothetical protein [Gemmataceae bacterium]
MSRQVYLLGVGLILVAVVFLITDYVLGPRPGVTVANFRRIQVGMTFEEVTDRLGPPTGFFGPPNGHLRGGREHREWWRNRVWIGIHFDEGRVCSKQCVWLDERK